MNALVAQLAEAPDLRSGQSAFESPQGHMVIPPRGPMERPSVLTEAEAALFQRGVCVCGCGTTTLSGRARALRAQGLTHAAIAVRMGRQRGHVKTLLLKPTIYIKGHSSKGPRWEAGRQRFREYHAIRRVAFQMYWGPRALVRMGQANTRHLVRLECADARRVRRADCRDLRRMRREQLKRAVTAGNRKRLPRFNQDGLTVSDLALQQIRDEGRVWVFRERIVDASLDAPRAGMDDSEDGRWLEVHTPAEESLAQIVVERLMLLPREHEAHAIVTKITAGGGTTERERAILRMAYKEAQALVLAPRKKLVGVGAPSEGGGGLKRGRGRGSNRGSSKTRKHRGVSHQPGRYEGKAQIAEDRALRKAAR